MENAQALIRERGFVSINALAASMNKDIPETKRLIFSLLQTSGDFQALYSDFNGSSYAVKRGVPLSPDSILAIEAIGFDGNAFQVEHNEKPKLKEGLLYQRGIISPWFQEERRLRNLTEQGEDASRPNRTDHSPKIINPPVEVKVSDSTQNIKKNILKPSKSSSQPTLNFNRQSTNKQVTFHTDKGEHKEKIKRIDTPHPLKAKNVDDMEKLLKNASLYSVEEDDDMEVDYQPLKRKSEPSTQSNKKFFPSPPSETSTYRTVRSTETRTFEDEKGRLVTEDVEIEEKVEVSVSHTSAIRSKGGQQMSMASFLISK